MLSSQFTFSLSTFGIFCALTFFLNELSSWIIEIFEENHLVSDSTCNVVNLHCPKFGQGMVINVRFSFAVGNTTRMVHK